MLYTETGMKFHEGGGSMMGYPGHNLMDMYPGPAINTMDWKNTSQVNIQLFRQSQQHISNIILLP